MIEPNELLELTKNHKEVWYKNEIPITQEEKRYYKCANPDGPVDNTLCPENDPHCNCPCKELQPRDAFIISSNASEQIDYWSIAGDAIFGLLNPFEMIWTTIGDAVDQLNASPEDSVYVVVNSSFDTLDAFLSYEEAKEYIADLPVSEEPTDDELEELLTELKDGFCGSIENSLGESWMGCNWDNPDHPSSCNCPCVGEDYPKFKEYMSTYSSFWDTPKKTPLLRNAQMTLINSIKAQMSLPGDFTLKPGNLVEISMKDLDPDKNEFDKSASGKWLVESISHIIGTNNHNMQVSLTRDSSYISLEDYESLPQ